MKQKHLIGIGAGLIFLTLGGAGCSSNGVSQATQQGTPVVDGASAAQPTPGQPPMGGKGGMDLTAGEPTYAVTPAAAADAKADDTFEVTGTNFSFTPSEMKVKKGDVVKIVFKNASGFHDFAIDEYQVRAPRIKGGDSYTFTFKADKAGTFEYYCSVGKHRDMGMKGNLIVQ